MYLNTKVVACLGIALAAWSFAMPAPVYAFDETLCSQANPTPPPCIPSAIATPLNGHILGSFDISYVNPTIHTYVLAASRAVAVGNGPLSNPRIIVVNTLTNTVVHQYNATPTFAGNCPTLPGVGSIFGPNGVILIEGVKSGGKKYGDIWAGDGPIYTPSCTGVLTTPSSVKVLELATGKTLATIPTGGRGRADELCFNPFSNVVLVANPSPVDNFITFIDEDSYGVLQQIRFDGTDPNSAPPGVSPIQANGIEQCQYNPRDGKFYLSIPKTVIPGSPPTPGPGFVVRISALPPFHVEAAFTIDPVATGCAGPAGLAIGPDSQIGLGCGGTNSLIIADGTGILPAGSTIAIVTGQGGADEIWFNHTSNHYYFSRSGAAVLGVEDAGPPPPPTADPTIATAVGSHSVAADGIKHEVYVPIRSNLFGAATVCSSFSGDPADDVTGCIAVYQDVGEIPPGSR
jgi:hypothetical protein